MKEGILYVALILFAVGAMWQLHRMDRKLIRLQKIIGELYSRDEMLKGHLCTVEKNLSSLHTSCDHPLKKSREYMFHRWRDFARLCFGEFREGAESRENEG